MKKECWAAHCRAEHPEYLQPRRVGVPRRSPVRNRRLTPRTEHQLQVAAKNAAAKAAAKAAKMKECQAVGRAIEAEAAADVGYVWRKRRLTWRRPSSLIRNLLYILYLVLY
jgi:hypothetical protein